MFPATAFTKLAAVEYPIIEAPMAAAITSPEVVAAVSNAGALGSFAGGAISPNAMREGVAEIRRRTQKPFAVNLFVLGRLEPKPAEVARAIELLAPFRDELGLPAASPPEKFSEDFSTQFETLLELQPAVASFTFGILTQAQVASLHAGGMLVVGTATTVAEARAWEAVGADAVCAQGSEAGGHRGTFLSDVESSLVGTMALVPQVVDAVRVPVIAAGGIMDGRGIAAALMLGASAVQLGTAFMTCSDSGAPAPWKRAIRGARDDQTRVSRVYSGRHARGVINDFMRRMTPSVDEIPAYPIQNALTGVIRRAAAQANRPEFMSLWAGQAAAMSRELSVAELVSTLVRETTAALRRQEIPANAD